MENKTLSPQHMIRIPARQITSDVMRMPPSAGDICILLEEGASLAVYIPSIEGVLTRQIDVFLGVGAQLEVLRPVIASGADAVDVHLNVRQAKDSSFRSFFMTDGGVLVREHVTVLLEGEGASVSLNGLHLLSGTSSAESYIFVDHAAPSTTSDQLYKSVLRDKAHSVFNGRIMVRRLAQLTNAYQLNKNLLMSPEAKVDTKPQLEIFADDVKCSHGAAIGQLDDDQIFYLQSRGIDRARAAEMLVKGFVEDVLSQVRAPGLKAEVEEIWRAHDAF